MRILKKKNKEDLKNIENQKEEKKDNSKKQLIVKKNKENKGRLLVSGIVTTLLVLIIIDIYILVNIGLEKITLPEFDFTENKIFTLSEETKTKLENLENEVKITFINYEDSNSVIKVAERYVLLNNKITIERINDLASRRDLMEEYSLDATDSLIVISSGERKTTLSEYDLYTYDYSTYETIDTTEEAFTNAILDVITTDKPKVYFMANHVQYQAEYYFYTIMSLIQDDANEVDTVDILSTGSIPEDCDTLVITTLSEDITEFEKDKIIEYINKGGELLILNGPNITGKNLTNFQLVLDQYGVTIEEGVIYEGSSSNMLNGYPDFIIEKIQSSSLTEGLNMNLNICLLDAASIKFNEEKKEELNVEYEELAYTSNKAFIRTNLQLNEISKTDSDSEEAEFVVGGIVNKKIDDNNSSKLIIFGNELFVSDMQLTINGYIYIMAELYNNYDVVLNSIAYLNEREDIITIRKDYDTVAYTATELQNNIVMAIIFIIPLVIIIIGIIVWQVRRRKK